MTLLPIASLFREKWHSFKFQGCSVSFKTLGCLLVIGFS
jgi:hypothetical protein